MARSSQLRQWAWPLPTGGSKQPLISVQAKTGTIRGVAKVEKGLHEWQNIVGFTQWDKRNLFGLGQSVLRMILDFSLILVFRFP